MNITYPINALPRAIPLCLGVQSEYGARPISIDVSEWVGRWPDIIVSVQPVRPGEDISYPAAGVTRSGNIVTWTPNAYDTEIPGTGSVEIIGLADGVKIIRTGAATTIAPTKSSVSKAPEDPMAAWADSVIRAGEQAKSSAEEALLLAQAANKSANNANASAVQAQSSQRAAATSASQAATYRTDAVNAMNAAKNSQTQANTSERNASAAAAAAYKSQQAAEAAAKRAEDAANSMGGGGTVSPGDGKLKADAIICDKSGESVSISDASEMDALSVVSHISAPEGVTGIKLTRTGRNIFGGMALVHSIVNQATGSVLDMDAKTVSYSANNVGGKTLFEYPFKENTQYTLYFTPAEGSSNSPNMQVFYVGETEGVRLAPITNKTVWVYKTAAGKTVERIAGRNFSGTSILLYEKCGIFEGVLTEADFAPYEAEMFTVALPETVTDGSFDWATGVLTINQDGASRTVQLDAKPIAMRDRYNTLWSSTGQTDVQYVADTKAYVDGHGADADSEYADNAGYAENAGYADNAGHAEEAGDAQTVKGRDIAAEVDALSEEIAEKVSLEQVVASLEGAATNLVNDSAWEPGFYYASGDPANEAPEWYGEYMRTADRVKVTPNTTYVAPLEVPFTIGYDNDRKAKLIIAEYDSEGNFLRRQFIERLHANMTVTEAGYYDVVEATMHGDAFYAKIAVTSYGVSPSSWFYFRAESDAPYGQKLLPNVTQSDNGKVLGIVDGAYTPVDTSARLVLSNSIKNDCARFSAVMRGITDVDSFLFFTDPHLLQGENYDDNFIASIDKIKKYYNATPTAFVVCGGDWYGDKDTYDEACFKSAYASAWMRGNFDNYYPLIGNHDTNQSGVNNDNNGSGIFTPETVRNLWNPGRNSNYYSFDGVHAKYYVLDTFGEVQSDSEYMREQIAWLGAALKSDDHANSAILMHIGFTSSDGTFTPGTFVIAPHTEKILQMCVAYNAGGQVTINDVQYDFAGCEGKVRFVLSGHTHYDCLDSTTGIPLIATAQLNQSGGLTFDLCAADYGNLKLRMTRIGDGEDRNIDMAN